MSEVKLKHLNFFNLLRGEKSDVPEFVFEFQWLLNHFCDHSEFAKLLPDAKKYSKYENLFDHWKSPPHEMVLVVLHALQNNFIENPTQFKYTFKENGMDSLDFHSFMNFIRAKTLTKIRTNFSINEDNPNENEKLGQFRKFIHLRNKYFLEWVQHDKVNPFGYITYNVKKNTLKRSKLKTKYVTIALELFYAEGIEIQEGVPPLIDRIQELEIDENTDKNRQKLIVSALKELDIKIEDYQILPYEIIENGVLEKNQYFDIKNSEICQKLISSWDKRFGWESMKTIVSKTTNNQNLLEQVAKHYLSRLDEDQITEANIHALLGLHKTYTKEAQFNMDEDKIPDLQMNSLKTWINILSNTLKNNQHGLDIVNQLEMDFYTNFSHTLYKYFDVDKNTYTTQNVRDKLISPIKQALKLKSKSIEFTPYQLKSDLVNKTDILEQIAINTSLMLKNPTSLLNSRKAESFYPLFKELNNLKVVEKLSENQKANLKSIFLSRTLTGLTHPQILDDFESGNHALLKPEDDWNQVMEETLKKLDFHCPVDIKFDDSKKKDIIRYYLELTPVLARSAFITLFKRNSNKANDSRFSGYQLDVFETLLKFNESTQHEDLKNDISEDIVKHMDVKELIKSLCHYDWHYQNSKEEEHMPSFQQKVNQSIINLVKRNHQFEIADLKKFINDRYIENEKNCQKNQIFYKKVNFKEMLTLIDISTIDLNKEAESQKILDTKKKSRKMNF
jgi:hypothetical protein